MRAGNQIKPRKEPQVRVYLGERMFQREGTTDAKPQKEGSGVEAWRGAQGRQVTSELLGHLPI